MSVLTVHHGHAGPHHGRGWNTAVGQAVGLARRAFNAVMRSRERHANEDIARYIQQSGGRLTDEIEREMMRRLTSNWNFRP